MYTSLYQEAEGGNPDLALLLNKLERSINRTHQHLEGYYRPPSGGTAKTPLRCARRRTEKTLRHIDALFPLVRLDRATRRDWSEGFVAKIFGLRKSARVLLAKLKLASRRCTCDQDPSANDMLVDSGMLRTEIGSAMLDVPAHLANADSPSLSESSESEKEDAGDHEDDESDQDSSAAGTADAGEAADKAAERVAMIDGMLTNFLQDAPITYSMHQG